MTPDFIRAAQYISRKYKGIDGGQKPIAHYMFSELLPDELWKRKGKLDHQGLSYRGLRYYIADILRLIEIKKNFLDQIGIDIKELISHIHDVVENKINLSGMFYGVLACAIWHNSFSEIIQSKGYELTKPSSGRAKGARR